MNALRPLFIALQFLTRLPIRLRAMPSERDIGRSLLYYPLVGLLLGLLLAALVWVMQDTAPSLRAAIVLAVWVLATGALHLDGLADSADAWVGGLGNRERTLAIMKDPYSGPAAVATLVIVLLIKFAALQTLTLNDGLVLALVLVLARAAVVLLLITTPYARPHGLGAPLATHAPHKLAMVTTALTAVAVLLVAGLTGLGLLFMTGTVLLLLRGIMIRRLGGTTGDTAGALIEITETAMLVGIAL